MKELTAVLVLIVSLLALSAARCRFPRLARVVTPILVLGGIAAFFTDVCEGKLWAIPALLGGSMNASVIFVNRCRMPLVGFSEMPEDIRAGFYYLADERTRLRQLGDRFALGGFSVGDLLIIGGGACGILLPRL